MDCPGANGRRQGQSHPSRRPARLPLYGPRNGIRPRRPGPRPAGLRTGPQGSRATNRSGDRKHRSLPRLDPVDTCSVRPPEDARRPTEDVQRPLVGRSRTTRSTQ